MSNRYFSYRDGRLHASGVSLDRLAAEVGTPFYCYDADALEHGYRHFAQALEGLPATICYALKANSNQAVIATFAALGAGADVVSEGEKIAVRWSGTGTHLGDGLGFQPTGNPVRLSGMLIVTVDNGKLVEGWNTLDELGLAQQIGAITLPV